MSSDNIERPASRYEPTTSREVFALQLAQHLHDESSLRSYVNLLGVYPIPFLLDILVLAKNEAVTDQALRERFWTVLGEQQDWRMNE